MLLLVDHLELSSKQVLVIVNGVMPIHVALGQ
jgi:hypothetical protein